MWILLLLVCVGVMVYGIKKEREAKGQGKPMMLGGAVGTIVFAWAMMLGCGEEDVRSMALAWQRVVGQRVGQYLAESYTGARIVIVTGPGDGLSEVDKIKLEGLKESAGNMVEFVGQVTPEFPEYMEEELEEQKEAYLEGMSEEERANISDEELRSNMMMVSEWYNAKYFDHLMERYKGETDIVLFIAEAPSFLEEAESWDDDALPRVAFCEGAAFEMLGPQFKAGRIVCAVTASPEPMEELTYPPSDVKEAFRERYLLITPENIEEIRSKYPNRFYMQE
jgi:hypothetical protein